MVTNLVPSTWRSTSTEIIEPGIQNRLAPDLFSPPPSIYSIIDEYGPFPAYSVMVGICDDGFPFMLGLDNPRSGSILLVGEKSHEKSQILKTLCVSSCLINQPEEIGICVITNKPNQYSDLMKYPNCQAVISSYERAAGEMIVEFSSVVEQRRSGRERGESLMLVIDDFHSIRSNLNDFSVYLNLKSLVTNGPGSGVWPIISIEPEDIHSSRGQLLKSFGTYIFEKAEHEKTYLPSNGRNDINEVVYEPNFNVIVGGRLIPISNLVV